MTRLSGDLIRHQLKTHTFGQNVIYIEKIGSTNTELKQYARQGAPEGLLYLTDEQLVGRGRLQRSWQAPAESSLLMSLLFRPNKVLSPIHVQRLTMICSLALADAIKTHTHLTIGLKWPNDLVWTDRKKLGGILTESEIEGDQLGWVVVGLGLNVNIDFSDLAAAGLNYSDQPSDNGRPLAQIATSLSTILGRDTSDLRLPILQGFLENVERRYDALKQGQSPHLEWEQRLVGLGQTATVTVLDEARQYNGIISGVDKNGALLLKQPDDTVVTIFAGDVTFRSATSPQ